jgi:predicted membrane chloride channel (bestrophin family)
MNKYLTIINYRTIISLAIAIVTLFFAYKFDLNFNIDLTLLSIAIIFPLVFNIRGAFRRREKALEHLSQFRSALKTIHNLFMSNPNLMEENKQELTNILSEISDKTIDHLRNNTENTIELDQCINKIFDFINTNQDQISSRLKDKIFRFVSDLHESVENLNAIHVHRTPISLKAYCEYFIYIFPFIYSPAIIYKIGVESPVWITYFVVIFSQFMLISLYNIQDQLEYPFDDVGMDDINLEVFRFDR